MPWFGIVFCAATVADGRVGASVPFGLWQITQYSVWFRRLP